MERFTIPLDPPFVHSPRRSFTRVHFEAGWVDSQPLVRALGVWDDDGLYLGVDDAQTTEILNGLDLNELLTRRVLDAAYELTKARITELADASLACWLQALTLKPESLPPGGLPYVVDEI